MRDVLKEFIDDYNKGLITLIDLENRLSFNEWKESKVPYKEKPYGSISEETITKIQHNYDCYVRMPKDPADIVEQKEISYERYKCILKLKGKIKEINWKELMLLVKGKTQEEIAKHLGITQSAVCKHLKSISDEATKLGLRELLYDVHRTHNNITQKNCYSSAVDIAMAHRDGTKHVCVVPEYLHECNCDSVCLMCSRCTSAKNKELLK